MTTNFEKYQDEVLALRGPRFGSHYVALTEPTLRTHLLSAGSGEPLLLIHGGNSVAAGMQPLLGGLAERFAVFAPDRPGCGLTEPFSYRGVDLRRHAVAFIRSTLDALGLRRVALVANSMGGYWSMAFALAYPERVSRLVLLGEPAGSARRAAVGYRILGTRGVNRLLYATKLRPTAASVRESYASRLVANIDRISPSYLAMALAAARQPGAQHAWLSMVERGTRWFGDSPLTYALRGELSQLITPTLFLWGENDSFGPPSLGQEMADLMPNGRAVTVADAGHLVWLDQPERTLALVTDFLADARTERLSRAASRVAGQPGLRG